MWKERQAVIRQSPWVDVCRRRQEKTGMGNLGWMIDREKCSNSSKKAEYKILR